MNVIQARELAKALNAAADAAEAAGATEVSLVAHLQHADDVARGELVLAIQAAQVE